MKTLIITRHGKAGELKENQPDLLRDLAPRGKKDAKKIAVALEAKDIVPGLIISSPAIRSVETARILGEILEIPHPAIITSDLLYGNFTTELFRFINMICPEDKVVMIIGHHPSLLLFIEFMSGLVLERFPTLATLVLDFDAENWSELIEKKGTLRKLFIPKDLS
jgi:phosphohistidine phosphatase